MTTAPVAANDNVRQFYVYQHRRNDTGEVFYVGKGTRDRAWSLAGRSKNRFWKGCAKHGFSVEIICDGLDEKYAHALEVMLIQFHGRRDNGTGPLANLTDGGEGSSGHVQTAEHRAKNGAANFGKKRSAEFCERMRIDRLGKKHNESRRENLSKAQRLSGPQVNNTSGYKGVGFEPSGKWSAMIYTEKKLRRLGNFKTPEEAARAYDVAAVAAWGAGNCYLNFPAEHLQAA